MIIVAMPKKPFQEGKNRNDHGGHHHGDVAEQALAGERRNHLGKNPKGGKDQDVDLRVPPGPDQVDVHHLIATEVIREEVHAEIPVEAEQREADRQDRERRNDLNAAAQRRPSKNGHAHQGHAGGAIAQNGCDEVHARKRGSHPRDLQAPDVIVDADARAVTEFRERRVGEPSRARELADPQ